MQPTDHDHQLRAMLKSHLSVRLGDDDLLVDEFLLAHGEVRADLALVNGCLEGFEIKAGKDTLDRLAHQVEAYGRIFDYAWVVTTQAHLKGVRTLVPSHWGLLIAAPTAGSTALRQVRKAKFNKLRDGAHLVRLLWRDEVLAKLGQLNLSKGLKSKPKTVLYPALAQAMPVDELSDYVRACLKARSDWRAGAEPRASGGSSHRAAK